MKPSILKPLLFVDGYNIIGAWPQLSQLRDAGSLEVARDRLIEDLTNYSAYQGFRTRIVFDAYMQKRRGSQESITDDVIIHYTTFGQTADSCIERWCADLQRDVRYFGLRLVVATSDQAQRHTVTGYGAEWMSAYRLASELEQAVQQGRQQYRAQGFGKKSKRSRTVLKPAVHDRLRALRSQLEQRPEIGS